MGWGIGVHSRKKSCNDFFPWWTPTRPIKILKIKSEGFIKGKVKFNFSWGRDSCPLISCEDWTRDPLITLMPKYVINTETFLKSFGDKIQIINHKIVNSIPSLFLGVKNGWQIQIMKKTPTTTTTSKLSTPSLSLVSLHILVLKVRCSTELS